MAVNQNNSWEEDNKDGKDNGAGDQSQGNVATSGLAKGGLADIFSMNSMTSDNRNMKIVPEVLEKIKDIYKAIKNSSTTQLQLSILPEVELATPSLSSVLPGIIFHKEVGGTMYLMPVLFSNKDLTINSEYISMNGNMGFAGIGQRVSAPLTPASYADKQLMNNLRDHYTKIGEPKGVKAISFLATVVQDMEMLNHPEAGEPKDWPHMIAGYLANQWEEGILVKVPQELTQANLPLVSPFKEKAAPYGKDGHAEARVSAINGRVTAGAILSPANMEVIVSTINNPNSQAALQANSKEVARVTATVSLQAQSYQGYINSLQNNRNQQQQQEVMNRVMNLGGGIYPNGFRPLQPVITIEEARAGEMMNYNQGLFPYFFGLHALMSTNNHFVFTEALRRSNVGVRGGLNNLEIRIDEALAQLGPMVAQQRITLNEKTISDTDLVNNWLRQNVSPHAIFQVNINLCGPHASIHNFLVNCTGKNRAMYIKTVIAVLDAMSNKKFSEIVARNVDRRVGWTPELPILHRTSTITVNGLAQLGDKKHNPLEIDEMMLGHLKGKGGQAQIQAFLLNQYGMGQDESNYKARCQKMRLELNQSIYDGNVHINSFAQTHIWDPAFLAVVGEALDSIGSMQVANAMGSFRNNQLAWAPGGGLATFASTGSNNPNGAGVGLGYGMAQAFA